MKTTIKQIIPKTSDIRRIRAIEKIVANKGKNKKKCLLEEGYSYNYAKKPSLFMNTKKTRQCLNWVNYELEEIQKRMEKTRNKARYKELSDSYVNLKKLSQLMGGGPTERLQITEKEKQEVDKAFKENE